ncbi:MAG: diphthamide biosynthesis enzyme Dph2 [Thermoprotei archaeon]|nr:MAG: diphthamide biosynthesis enzyme Dph2 [Thermoprotei archaeon]
MENPYEINISQIMKWVLDEKAKKVLVQAPDGIKPYLKELLDVLSKNTDVYVSGSHTWGGCDIALKEAYTLGIKHIIHLGHHGPVRVRIPEDVKVLFVPAFAKVDIEKVLEREIEKLRGYTSIGLLSSLQHINQLDNAKRSLERRGYEVLIGMGNLPYPGQVIGCDVSAAVKVSGKVSCFLVVAGGFFHGLGVYLKTKTKTFVLDPYVGKIFDIEPIAKKILARHMYNLSRALDAETFGVIVSIKPGQYSVGKALEIYRKIKRYGKKAYLIVVDEVEPSELENFAFLDAYINTACPRLNIDSEDVFKKPIIGIGEIDYVLRDEIEKYDIQKALQI